MTTVQVVSGPSLPGYLVPTCPLLVESLHEAQDWAACLVHAIPCILGSWQQHFFCSTGAPLASISSSFNTPLCLPRSQQTGSSVSSAVWTDPGGLVFHSHGHAEGQSSDGLQPRGLSGINPMFSLASLKNVNGRYGSNARSPVGAGSSTGEQEEEGSSSEGTSEDSEEELSRLRCGICRRSLTSGAAGMQHIKICDGCHAPYHSACCRRRRRGERVKSGGSEDSWYCSPTCKAQHTGLLLQCERGECPAAIPRSPSSPVSKQAGQPQQQGVVLQGPASWQLAQGAATEGSPQWAAVEDAAEVLAHEYGPFVMNQVEGSDFVAVLRRGGTPVSAVTLDCFGGHHGCAVDLGTTHPEARQQGHMRALVSTLEQFLAAGGASQQLLVLVPDPSSPQGATAQHVFQGHLGYSKLSNRQVHRLQEEVQLLSLRGPGIAVYAKKLHAPTSSSDDATSSKGQAFWRRSRPALLQGATHLSVQAAAAGEGTVPTSAAAGKGVAGSATGGAAKQVEHLDAGSSTSGTSSTRPRRTRSYWRFRLWAWALRKAVKASTFGLVG